MPAAFVSAGQSSSSVAGHGWLDDFGDPVLKSLVREAWSRNPDLSVAAGVFQESVASSRAAASTLYPQFNGAGSSRFQKAEGNETRDYSAGLNVTWEAYLWGRLRADRDFASKVAQSRGLDYLQARHSLAAAVAEAYFAVIASQEQLEIDQLLLASEKDTALKTRQRVDAGLGSSIDRNLGEASVNLAEASIKDDQAALAQAKRALELLLGRYPAAAIANSRRSLPSISSGTVASGVPSTLLERRPDIRAAELLVDASYDQIKSAKAARLPRLTLKAGIQNLIDPSTFIRDVAADIMAPLFTGGRLKAQEEVANARQRQALGKFASISLKAFGEVENSLSNQIYLDRRRSEISAASTRLKNASTAAIGRYDQGVIPILDLQQIRARDFQTRSLLLGVRFEQVRQRIALYRALGGKVFSSSNSTWNAALNRELNQR